MTGYPPCQRCGRPYAAHRGGRCPRRGVHPVIVVLVVVAVLLWAGIRVAVNEAARSTPPAECQLLGGTWSVWDGWRCG